MEGWNGGVMEWNDGVMERRNINRGFKKLRVWNDAVDLYVLTCKILSGFPFELKKTAGNCIDSSHSIIRNIAEGNSRRSVKEYIHFLYIALGSSGEYHSCICSFLAAAQITKTEFDEAPRRKQRGILKQNQLFTLMQNYVLFLKPLVSNVYRNTCLIAKFTDCVNKISITPKFPSPNLFFHLWILSENLSGRDTFHNRYNLCRAHSRYRLYQKVDMVVVRPYLKKVNFISLFYFKTYVLQRFINLFTYHNSPIFGRTYKMIQQYRNIMRFMYVFAFAHTNKDITFTPQAAGN